MVYENILLFNMIYWYIRYNYYYVSLYHYHKNYNKILTIRNNSIFNISFKNFY